MKYRIGIIGFGGVGQQFAKLLLESSSSYRKHGLELTVCAVSDLYRGSAFDANGLSLSQLSNLQKGKGSLSLIHGGNATSDNGKVVNEDYIDVIIEGSDAALKVLILANQIMGCSLTRNDVSVKGITNLKNEDIWQAKSAGFRWRLLGIVDDKGNARVEPVRLSMEHPLAAVVGASNAITFSTDHLGDITVSGSGAGLEATAYALVADLFALPR